MQKRGFLLSGRVTTPKSRHKKRNLKDSRLRQASSWSIPSTFAIRLHFENCFPQFSPELFSRPPCQYPQNPNPSRNSPWISGFDMLKASKYVSGPKNLLWPQSVFTNEEHKPCWKKNIIRIWQCVLELRFCLPPRPNKSSCVWGSLSKGRIPNLNEAHTQKWDWGQPIFGSSGILGLCVTGRGGLGCFIWESEGWKFETSAHKWVLAPILGGVGD